MTNLDNLNWLTVVSSNISRIKYNRPTMEMLVEFKGDSQYLYQSVPDFTFMEIITSESIGSTFSRLVKSQPTLFPYERLAA